MSQAAKLSLTVKGEIRIRTDLPGAPTVPLSLARSAADAPGTAPAIDTEPIAVDGPGGERGQRSGFTEAAADFV